jgi:hypothetical protein
MADWTNPNSQKIVALASIGSLSGGTVQLPAGGTVTPVNLVNVSQFSSYDLNTYIFQNNGGGGVGNTVVVQILIQWFDDLVSGIPVFEEDWWLYTGRVSTPSQGVASLAGSGPMHGRYMTVQVNNNFGNNACTIQWLNLFGSNRTVPYSDWRQNASQVNPITNGLSIQSSVLGDGFDNILYSGGTMAIGASASIWLPMCLYSGPVWYRFQATAAPQNNVVICAAAFLAGGQIVFGTGNPTVLVNIPADTAEHEGTFLAPRAPCYMAVHGNAAASSISFQAIAQQAA